MHVRLIAAACVAIVVSSCSSVYDTADFVRRDPAKPGATAETAAAGDAAKSPAADTAAATPVAKSDTAATAAAADRPAAAAAAPDATKDGAPPPVAASAAETPAAMAPAQPRGLLAMFRAATAAPAVAAAEAAVNAEAATAQSGKAGATAEAPAAAPAPVVEDDGGDEVSEADLAGEVEADPTKIAVPEEPIDDGLEHDFVNVYSSKPDAPVESIPGLPGVSWEGNLVLASRGDDGDPRGLFGGEDHPFARTVPGIPRQIVQAANGLLLAHSAINVSCVKPDLLGLVRRAEGHFGHKVVVTSGYRSPAHNRRVHGAQHSQHMYCNALDLYMPGVARDDLARFFFAQPDRGGIGLYCHTRSIHIDTGRRRQWRWACRRPG